jgi:hypothetical protein
MGQPGARFHPRDQSLHYEPYDQTCWLKIIIAAGADDEPSRDQSLDYERPYQVCLLHLPVRSNS